MTIFYSHQDRLDDLTGGSRTLTVLPRLRGLARRAIGRTSAAFKIIHQVIVTAKTRRHERELLFHAGSCGGPSLQPSIHERNDLARVQFPKRPLIHPPESGLTSRGRGISGRYTAQVWKRRRAGNVPTL
jgi:hypothetical protein